MTGSVETMCAGCANLNLDNGGCKLRWVSKQNQIEKAIVGFCEDAQVLSADAETQEAPVVLIPESWANLKSK